jgi:hypothetical protein
MVNHQHHQHFFSSCKCYLSRLQQGLLILLLLASTHLSAQVDIYSEISMTDQLRIRQLSGVDSNGHLSFNLRTSANYFVQKDTASRFWKRNAAIRLNSVGFLQQQNSLVGLSSNDGNMLPNVGSQLRGHLNISMRLKFLHIQLAPEWISAENLTPTSFELDKKDGNYFAKYYFYIVNKIDMFPRFGKERITRLLPGQSSVTLQGKHLAFGISTENIWWGPALRNSLVMSNHASGFTHLTLNTLQPIKTPIGHLEAQVIYGNLQNVQFEHPDHQRMRSIWSGGIAIKDSTKRSLSGFMISWEPKWLRNFYTGIASTGTGYNGDTTQKMFSFPFFTTKKPLRLGSFFMRYVLPKDRTELYIELGRADRLAGPHNIIRDSIPMGYTAGIRKLIPMGKKGGYFHLGLELTRLQLPDPRMIFTPNEPFGRPQTNSWYTNSTITQGYTNNAEVMGAWIGPGSNSQTLQLGWIKGYKRIMITGERVINNNDFFYYNYLTPSLQTQNQNNSQFWANLNTTAQVQWNFGKLLVSAAWSYTSLLNYRWIKLDGGFSGPSKLSDRRNTQTYFSIGWGF